MNTKRIYVNKYVTVDFLKEKILKKCNLYGNNRQHVQGFEEKVKQLDVGEEGILSIVVDWDEVRKDLSFQVSMENRPV